MEIESFLTLSAGVYSAQVGLAGTPTALTPVEVAAFAQYGEPLIEIGGVFGSGETTFTVPTNPRRFPSQFPVKLCFSLADSGNADALAELFITTVKARIVTGRNTQIDLTSATLGRQVETL